MFGGKSLPSLVPNATQIYCYIYYYTSVCLSLWPGLRLRFFVFARECMQCGGIIRAEILLNDWMSKWIIQWLSGYTQTDMYGKPLCKQLVLPRSLKSLLFHCHVLLLSRITNNCPTGPLLGLKGSAVSNPARALVAASWDMWPFYFWRTFFFIYLW